MGGYDFFSIFTIFYPHKLDHCILYSTIYITILLCMFECSHVPVVILHLARLEEKKTEANKRNRQSRQPKMTPK